MGCATSISIPEDEWLLGLAATKSVDLSLSPLLNDTSATSPATATAIRDARPTILLTPTWPRPYAPLSGAGFKALCCAASATIRTVSVTEAAVPKVSPAAIADALASLPSLAHLSLAGATLPRRVVIRLAAKKGSLAALLTAVTLTGPCVDCGTVAALQVSAPHLNTLRLVDVFPSFDWLTVIAALNFPALTKVTVNGSVLTNGVQIRAEDSPAATHQRARKSNEVEVAPSVRRLSSFSAQTEEHPLPAMPRGPTTSDRSMNLASTGSGVTSRVLLHQARDHQPRPPASSPRPHELRVEQNPRHILVPESNTSANNAPHNDSPRRTGPRQPQAFSQSLSQSPCQSQYLDRLMSCSRNPLSLLQFAESPEFSAEVTPREDDVAPVAPASVGAELGAGAHTAGAHTAGAHTAGAHTAGAHTAGAHTTNGAERSDFVREVSMGGEKKTTCSLAPEDVTVDAKRDGILGGAPAALELVAVSRTATPQLSTTVQHSSAADVGLVEHFLPAPPTPPVTSDNTSVPFSRTTIAPRTTGQGSLQAFSQSSVPQPRPRVMNKLCSYELLRCTVADDRGPATPDHVREWVNAQCALQTSIVTLPLC